MLYARVPLVGVAGLQASTLVVLFNCAGILVRDLWKKTHGSSQKGIFEKMKLGFVPYFFVPGHFIVIGNSEISSFNFFPFPVYTHIYIVYYNIIYIYTLHLFFLEEEEEREKEIEKYSGTKQTWYKDRTLCEEPHAFAHIISRSRQSSTRGTSTHIRHAGQHARG